MRSYCRPQVDVQLRKQICDGAGWCLACLPRHDVGLLLWRVGFGFRALDPLGVPFGMKLPSRSHKLLWILAQLVSHLRIGFQVIAKFRMVFQVFLILEQGRVLCQLFGNLGMASQELSEASRVGMPGVAIHVVLTSVVALFLAHESVGIFLDLLAYTWMLLQVGLQVWMVV